MRPHLYAPEFRTAGRCRCRAHRVRALRATAPSTVKRAMPGIEAIGPASRCARRRTAARRVDRRRRDARAPALARRPARRKRRGRTTVTGNSAAAPGSSATKASTEASCDDRIGRESGRAGRVRRTPAPSPPPTAGGRGAARRASRARRRRPRRSTGKGPYRDAVSAGSGPSSPARSSITSTPLARSAAAIRLGRSRVRGSTTCRPGGGGTSAGRAARAPQHFGSATVAGQPGDTHPVSMHRAAPRRRTRRRRSRRRFRVARGCRSGRCSRRAAHAVPRARSATHNSAAASLIAARSSAATSSSLVRVSTASAPCATAGTIGIDVRTAPYASRAARRRFKPAIASTMAS